MKTLGECPADVEIKITIRWGEEFKELGTRIGISDALMDTGGAGRCVASQVKLFGEDTKRVVDAYLALKRNTVSEGVSRKWSPSSSKTEITEKDIDEFIEALEFQAADKDRK